MTAMDSRASVSRPKILLVDDSEINRDVIGRILSKAGYDVDTASDGEAACSATWSKAYDLVLMDIEMPGMNGFEAAARIRAREGVMSGVKIAALTATVQPDAELYSFWSGIDEFMSKPIDPHLFLERVAVLVADRDANANDWKPVWRLAVFSKFTERLEDGDAVGYLDEFSTLLDGAATAIDAKMSGTNEFLRIMRDLGSMSSLLGFDEIAGLCARHLAEARDARCRDPNLIGAFDRAHYAIDVYRRERNPTPIADWWSRTRVNVQSLFRGRLPAGASTQTAS